MQMFDLDARTIASLMIPLELGGITHIDGLYIHRLHACLHVTSLCDYIRQAP